MDFRISPVRITDTKAYTKPGNTRVQASLKADTVTFTSKKAEKPAENNLDELIAGYDEQKDIIRSRFLNQIAAEKAGLDADVPNSIVLFGAIGTGKTTLIKAMAEEAGCKLVEINPDVVDFPAYIRKTLEEAKDRYNKEQQRTIVVLNEADTMLNDSPETKRNIIAAKNWLDNCAMLPDEDITAASASTLVLATNHPLNITDEIIKNDEKVDFVVALKPAEGDDIEKILKFYMEKYDPDRAMMDWKNYDFSSIVEKLNPNEKGAYGNDRLKRIVEAAYEDYRADKNTSNSFEECLSEKVNSTKRNIKPNRIEELNIALEELPMQ